MSTPLAFESSQCNTGTAPALPPPPHRCRRGADRRERITALGGDVLVSGNTRAIARFYNIQDTELAVLAWKLRGHNSSGYGCARLAAPDGHDGPFGAFVCRSG